MIILVEIFIDFNNFAFHGSSLSSGLDFICRQGPSVMISMASFWLL